MSDVVDFFIILKAHMAILFIIKVNIAILIKMVI